MKRNRIERITKIQVVVREEADIQKVVTQIHLAAGRASKGGQVQIHVQTDSGKPKVKTKQESQEKQPGSDPVDPGEQNEAPGTVPVVPEAVLRARQLLEQGKIPNAKDRKALAQWEAANPDL